VPVLSSKYRESPPSDGIVNPTKIGQFILCKLPKKDLAYSHFANNLPDARYDRGLSPIIYSKALHKKSIVLEDSNFIALEKNSNNVKRDNAHQRAKLSPDSGSGEYLQ
jgi:hypothetical protein